MALPPSAFCLAWRSWPLRHFSSAEQRNMTSNPVSLARIVVSCTLYCLKAVNVFQGREKLSSVLSLLPLSFFNAVFVPPPYVTSKAVLVIHTKMNDLSGQLPSFRVVLHVTQANLFFWEKAWIACYANHIAFSCCADTLTVNLILVHSQSLL